MMTPMSILTTEALQLSQADGCMVIGAERTEANLRWAGNTLTTNGQMHSRSITVISTVAVDGGVAAGVVTRSIADSSELPALVAASERAARAAGPAEDAYDLVQPDSGADGGAHSGPDADFDSPAAATGIEVFTRFAAELGQAFALAGREELLLYGFAEHALTSYYLATSTGIRRRFDQPDGRLELNAKSADLARSAWAGVYTADFADVDVAAMLTELRQRLDWARTSIELPAGRYDTVLPPSAVADLLIYAYWTASARDAEEGRNVFAAAGSAGGTADADLAGDSVISNSPAGTRIGERMATLPLTLRSNPAEPGLQCAPFQIVTGSASGLQSVFDNGAPITATSWITDGVLSDLVRTRNWAARTQAKPSSLIDNLILDGHGSKSLDELVAGVERGLLLTCLWYIREVDPQTLLLTGLTRDGVYLIENGKVVGAVNNFRFNESPVDLLSRISEVGRTERTLAREWSDYFGRTAMPPIRVPDFNMSTVSQAS